jgi:DNA-binding HxlR family transcriptional regulator
VPSPTGPGRATAPWQAAGVPHHRPGRRSRPAAPADRPAPGPDEGLRTAVERVGDRWVLLVVDALLAGPRRFGDLTDQLGVAPNILSRRLRDLEADGLVVSAAYTDRPVRLQYELTAPGRELAGALTALAAWGARREGRTPPVFHDACGTALEARPWCPTCDRSVGPDEPPGRYEV